ncbi:MAG: HD domain-containing protein [Myxococcota bacterium]
MTSGAGETVRVRFAGLELEDSVARIAAAVARDGGRALLVGGAVRDALLGRVAEDADLEVFGLSPEAVIACVQRVARADVVGRGFPILRLRGRPVDVTVPRRGRPSGDRDFAFGADPSARIDDALARRDFRINAMAWDPRSGELVDPHQGAADLRRRRLRHTGERFGEDPLRVLRGMQLVARFALTPDPDTIAVCRTLSPAGLAAERIRGEWRKLLLQGEQLGAGLAFLHDAHWLGAFPELAALVGCAQDPTWHPEGDVWVHTGHCLDAFAEARLGNPEEDWIVGLAVLCHDLGKPETTRERDGRLRSYGHDARGVERTRSFLTRFAPEPALLDAVEPLVAHHLAPAQLYRDRARVGDAAIRRLARRVGRIDRLVRVARADHAGRPPLPPDFPAGDWLLARASRLGVEEAPPLRLVLGRDLLPLGIEGRRLGRWLAACYEAQLAGAFDSTEAGVAWVQARNPDGEPPETPEEA